MLLSCRPSCSPICSCDNVRSDTKDKQESLTTQRNVLYKEVLKRLSKRYFFFLIIFVLQPTWPKMISKKTSIVKIFSFDLEIPVQAILKH